jgi:L-fuculose-phosphate aldolase
MIIDRFQSVGRDLFATGLVSSNTGNLSVRMGDRLIITRRGCNLGGIQEHDLIETGTFHNDRNTPLASVELAVHRAIYRETPAAAIVHAHPSYAVALSLTDTVITPLGSEALTLLENVPVVGWNMEVKPGGLADVIAAALKEHRIVMIHGHGSFAIGQLLEEAHNFTTMLEESCRVICLLRSLQAGMPKK